MWITAPKKRILSAFDSAMRSSDRMAAASWAMADQHNKLYNCNALPVIPSLDAALAKPPAQRLESADTLTIGMARTALFKCRMGKIFSRRLSSANWQIGSRKVRVKVLGRTLSVTTSQPVEVEFLGWRDQPETIELLSKNGHPVLPLLV